MTLAWLTVVALAGWFGFELGRKWTEGEEEDLAEAEEERRSDRGGIKLRRITIRR